MSDEIPTSIARLNGFGKPMFMVLTRKSPGNHLRAKVLVNLSHVTDIWQYVDGTTILSLSSGVDASIAVVETPDYIMSFVPEDCIL